MKTRIIWSILTLSIFYNTYSQDSARFYQTIDTLSSEYFYGRGYTNDGHQKTADYLYEVLSSADYIEKQPFTLSINHFYNEMNLILDEDTLAPCYEYIPLPQASTGKGNLKIKYLDSTFFSNSSRISKLVKSNLSKYAITYNQKHESKITDHPMLRKKIYSQSAALLKLTDGETLKSFSPEAWMPPAFSIKESSFENQKKINFELNQKIKEITSQNIIATIQGKDTTLKELIICAHYDHVGGYQACFIPGANDNATGVSMLLELFYYYKVHQPKRTIKFIAFAGEEVGLVGSKYYVEHTDLSNIEFVLNLDLYGGGSGGITVVNATVFENQFKLLENINKNKSYVSKIKKRGEAANSDHYFFSANGIPAFFIYSNGDVGGYHNINDTPEKLEIGYFTNMFLLLKEFTLSF